MKFSKLDLSLLAVVVIVLILLFATRRREHYSDNQYYPDPQQPAMVFTRNIGQLQQRAVKLYEKYSPRFATLKLVVDNVNMGQNQTRITLIAMKGMVITRIVAPSSYKAKYAVAEYLKKNIPKDKVHIL